MAPEKKSRSKDVISREYTINLHKALHGITFKKRAPKAVSYVRFLPQALALISGCPRSRAYGIAQL